MKPAGYDVVDISSIRGESDEETLELKELFERAHTFLADFKWCRSIRNAYFGYGIGGVLAVFLFEIEPSSSDVDSMLWVIVGDVPPAYITTENNSTWKQALEGYSEEMEKWVEAVKNNQSTQNLIPVNADATIENAKELETRLEFIKSEILA